VSYRNFTIPIEKGLIPNDLFLGHETAKSLVSDAFVLFRHIRELAPGMWFESALSRAKTIGLSLRQHSDGRSALSPALLVEFAGLGRPRSEFGVDEPSTHEWALRFAREALEQVWIAITGRSHGGTEIGRYLDGQTENPLYEKKPAGETAGLVDSLVRKHKVVQKHLQKLDLPDEQSVYSALKTEACMAAARRPQISPERVRFDDDARMVYIDDEENPIDSPTAYLLFKVVALARPDQITSVEIEKTPGLRRKKLAREKDKLPEKLKRMLHSNTSGHWLVLPPKKLS
jgi:hypothetical protein